jgi:LacI family transcriptional regulator
MKKGPISLKDIARELNLSVSTVSRSIRNVGEISPETRQKVLDLAGKYNYRPNPYSMSLLGNKTKTLGVIIPEIENYLFASMLKGINDAASQHDYRILSIFSNDTQEGDHQAIDELLHRRVDGILTCPARDTVDTRHYMPVLEYNLPITFFYRSLSDFNAPCVVTDHENATYTVTRSLIEKGISRIALIASLEPISEDNQRFIGYQRALSDHRISFKNELIIHSTSNYSTLYASVINLLGISQPPEAIICNDDSAAMTVIKILKDKQIAIPDRINVIGYNDDPFSSFMTPSISTIAQPGYLIGYQAAKKTLQNVISPDQKDTSATILQSGFLERDSSLSIVNCQH